MKGQNHLRETEKMFIDLHLHESAYSPDSQMTLDELVQAAREKGLGAVCITDHDSMGLTEYAKEYSDYSTAVLNAFCFVVQENTSIFAPDLQ